MNAPYIKWNWEKLTLEDYMIEQLRKLQAA